MDDRKAVYISHNDKISSGYVCAFCDRIFDNIDKVNQVVVSVSAETISNCKVRWMCEICKDQGRYVTNAGLILLDMNTKVTVEQIHREWGHRIYSRYRKEVLGNK